jgi:flavodoxin
MKILVVSYSRSGNTKKIAEQIAKKLDADFDEVIDMKDRHRKIIGWLIAGKDAMAKEKTEIKYKKDPTEYDLVIVGTPIWAWTMTPAIRTYLTENKFSEVAFFCTYG